MRELELKLRYLCDRKRHLICVPYTIKNLHAMADDLGLHRRWFHRDHYDIPRRRIDEITRLCEVVETRQIVMIIRGRLVR